MLVFQLHFVHWNSEKYANISEASSKDDGLAVLGLLAGVVRVLTLVLIC